MGKIRIKTLGDETTEEAEKQKKAIKNAEKLSRAKSASGGKARETASEATEQTEQTEQPQLEPAASSQKLEAVKRPKKKFAKAKSRSTSYTEKLMEIDKNKTYPMPEALELLRKVKMSKFDETVELHINTTEAGISGQVKLPHGSGKELKIAIASDELLSKIEAGKIDFDILIAPPDMMPKLTKVAKVLGPKGLMPNPKNGTISDNPEEAMKKFQGGQISFKTESKVPLMHLTVGKMSFGTEKLAENIQEMFKAVKKSNIMSVTLKSTMSPGIKIKV